MRRWSLLGCALLACLGMAGCGGTGDDLDSDDAAARLRAIHDLEREGSDEAVGRLGQAAQGQNVGTAAEAVWALGRMRNPTAIEALRQTAASSEQHQTRSAAILALTQQAAQDREQSDKVRQILRQFAQEDKSPTVRATAAGALGEAGTLDDVDFLIEVASQDQNLRVQSQGIGAVERLLGVRFGYDSTASAKEREAALARAKQLATKFAPLFKRLREEAQP